MTYYDNWSGFIQAAHSLFIAQPLKTRYSVKYVKGEKFIVLKVTDDRKCCKYKLSNTGNRRQLNQLNKLFLNWSITKDLGTLQDLPLKVSHANTNKKVNTRRV